KPIAVDSFNTLRSALLETRPGQKIVLEVLPQKDIASLKEKTAAAFSSLKAKRVEVELQAAPVSILRPEGLVRSYSDYQNLRGIQGTVSMDDVSQRSALQVMKAPEKKKPLDKTDQTTPEESKDKPATTTTTKTETASTSDKPTDKKAGEKPASKDSAVAETKLIDSSPTTFVSAEEVIDLERHLADPERKLNSDPLSFMLTLGEYDEVGKLKWYPDVSKATHMSRVRSSVVGAELPEAQLRNGYWEYVQAESNENSAVFRKILLPYNLEVRKVYSLVKGTAPNAKGRKDRYAQEYHLTLRVEVVNLDKANAHKVSYLLDGPTGLPIEGAWYSSGRKTGPGWGLYGLRDLVLQMKGKPVQVVKCSDVANDLKTASDKVVLDYIGVDTQYFQCTMIPVRQDANKGWHEGYSPLRVGSRDKDLPDVTNVSFRLKSNAVQLEPAGQDGDRLSHEYQIFAGPKQQQLLNNYALGDTLVYGWFWFAAKPLAAILHFFHDYMVFNYGLAIIMLTILVRLILFPMSMKQVTSSIKMQELQPELAKLKERYQDNPQEMMRAQQALFREHGVSPMSGCLPLFIQLPIFIGLYKALSLDVNLYGAPLFFESFRWCSNLAAPDMLIDWSSFWNSWNCYGFNMGHGMLYLGPFFNLLPMLTIVLFLVQQKFMMPPVIGDDETAKQQRMMRRMMNFMMLFMGLMFFKIPSGLCVYFVCSSLWGILERQFHPKQPQPGQNQPTEAKPQTAQGSWFGATTEKKQEAPSSSSKKQKRNRRTRGESAPQE
ncbi:MAG: YidC/Oxa1 family insertase periplasmic-domain containing protein, partial [Planctomycetia bacterium]|nr:YidC/Oxa1 family insertase periplasmic-domain containing protein [Planctomycetia bacterium]